MPDAEKAPGHYDGDGCTFPDPGHFAEKDAGNIETGKAGVSDAETLAAEPGQSVVEPADRVKHPGTSPLPAAEKDAPFYACACEPLVNGGCEAARLGSPQLCSAYRVTSPGVGA